MRWGTAPFYRRGGPNTSQRAVDGVERVPRPSNGHDGEKIKGRLDSGAMGKRTRFPVSNALGMCSTGKRVRLPMAPE